MKKEVKILTFHNIPNYGASLQSYALKTVVESMGYNVEFINYINNDMLSDYKIISSKKSWFKNMKSIIKFFIYNRQINKRNKNFDNFINSNFKLTKKYFSLNELQDVPPTAYAYICGSDQVWNSNTTKTKSNVYFLPFGSSQTKRISYAPSTGSTLEIQNNIDFFRKNMDRFDNISVREKNAALELMKLTDKKIDVVLDPTLLLDKDAWEKIINYENHEGEYILEYTVSKDEQESKLLNDIAKKENLKIINFDPGKNSENLIHRYDADAFEFLRLIYNAKYVITTSFHATVFSVIFEKKFVVVPHRKTGMRVINLLNSLSLNDRIVNEYNTLDNVPYNSEIDYKAVKEKLAIQKEHSLNWLKDSLKYKEGENNGNN